MRKMSDGSQTVRVKRYILLKNFWEYYIIEDEDDGVETTLPEHPTRKDDNPIQFAYVMGDFDEFGSVDLNEMKPYIIGDTVHIRSEDIAPPTGWNWVD